MPCLSSSVWIHSHDGFASATLPPLSLLQVEMARVLKPREMGLVILEFGNAAPSGHCLQFLGFSVDIACRRGFPRSRKSMSPLIYHRLPLGGCLERWKCAAASNAFWPYSAVSAYCFRMGGERDREQCCVQEIRECVLPAAAQSNVLFFF